MNMEEYNNLIENIRNNMDEETRALQSDNFATLMSAYNTRMNEIEGLNSENERLKNTNNELLLTNGKLFQQIGFKKEENEKKIENKEKDDIISISNIINDKGEMI